ncbi:hypothetical protein C5167_031639 [Papaver somniferum]|uniref:Uncharacterized protein n=2 Tax=Papaver somniferum TaxID=3469 RepID=A0A4Y7K4V4_PAPSO|nr:hypothetical protein C5167_031639 [Papaver somniferum]
MFRSLFCRLGANLRRTTATTINGGSFSSSSSTETRYFLFTLQNPDVLVINRASSMFCSCSATSNSFSSSSDSSFVVSFLINSCGLSESESLTVSKKIKFNPKYQPDLVVKLFQKYGFPKPQISKLITRRPVCLLSNPLKTLKPKLDFFKSRGLHGIELIVTDPIVLTWSLKDTIIPTFDILKSILRTDRNIIEFLKRTVSQMFSRNLAKTLVVNLERLRYEGVPQSYISKYLLERPIYIGDADKFEEAVEKVKEMGFDPLKTTFLVAIEGLTVSEASWYTKVDAYKRWGWSDNQIQKAFRQSPRCMMYSVKKITSVMDFLVNEMGYDSSSIEEAPMILNNSLKEGIIPRCSVVRILVSNGLIKEKLSPRVISRMTDKSFSDKFVKPYEHEAPELMMVFQGQLKR